MTHFKNAVNPILFITHEPELDLSTVSSHRSQWKGMGLLNLFILAGLLNSISGDLLPLEVSTIQSNFNSFVSDIITDSSGNLIISDAHAVWNVDIEVNPPTKHLIAGSSIHGYKEGAGSEARLNRPRQIIMLNDTYILLSDEQNHCLRLIHLQTGSTSRYAGICQSNGFDNGYRLNATFDLPIGLIKLKNKIFISAFHNHAIRVLESDIVTTLYRDSPLLYPRHITAWNDRSIYVTVNHGVVRIDLDRTVNAELITGSSTSGDDDGSLSSSRFTRPTGITHLNNHTLIIGSQGNERLRIVDLKMNNVTSICSGEQNSLDGNRYTCGLNKPWSVHVYKDMILVGEDHRIRSLPLYSIISNNSPATNPTTRATTTRATTTRATTTPLATARTKATATPATTTTTIKTDNHIIDIDKSTDITTILFAKSTSTFTSQPNMSSSNNKVDDDNNNNLEIIIPVVVLTVICIIALTLVLFFHRKRRKSGRKHEDELLTSLAISSYPTEIQKLIRKRGIEPSRLSLEERVGHGNFGIVRRATLYIDKTNKTSSIVVAVKLLKTTAPGREAVEAFLYEALYMSQLAHPNLIHLIALICSNGEPPALILPYMGKGDLRTLIKTQSMNFNTADLLNFADQIVSGCKYLESQQVVHRDIALSNCLVSDLFVVKISDFGLSREDNYQVDVKGRQLRWKWLSPECMSEGRFTSKSDVWAFGILLSEMFSDGGMPYPAIASASELEESFKTGYRMMKPEKMPDYIYGHVLQMWSSHPEQRPTFYKLDEVFKSIMREVEGDINYDYTPDTMESLFIHEIEGGSGESQFSTRPSLTGGVSETETMTDHINGAYLEPTDMMHLFRGPLI